MRKNNRKMRESSLPEYFLVAVLLSLLIWASSGPSEASESHEIVEKGHYGPERYKTVQRPVEPNSGVSEKKGWIVDKRIDLKVVRTNEYTETRGWVDGEYMHTKELPNEASHRQDND